ncbi:MAG: type II toxin-antitoxin system RelE/ParE family toxin [Clostridia bacterium]|nr:type II toxin-antitoxin system RelE/ParE family toxin [Clostridia bacterium]
MNKIYNYINEELYAENAAKNLMKKVEDEVQRLKYSPKIHAKIEKIDELKRNYRKIVINNYIILYTIDEKNHIVFISHMYYGGKNYIYNTL